MEETRIVGRFIIEILGSPEAHVVKSLKAHIDNLRSDYDIVTEKYEPAMPKDKLFTQFVELEVSFKKLRDLLDFCFDNLPSSVEIISPEQLSLSMADFEDLMNDFQAKLHHADMMLKGLQAQKEVLDRNALNVFHNFIKFACSNGPQKIEDLSKLVGVGKKELSPFVENLVAKGMLKKEGDIYTAHG